MKLKHCLTLTAILIILFSLSAVAAGENITDDANLAIGDDSVCVDTVLDDTPLFSDEDVDLSVRIDFENTKVDNNVNPEGSSFPWTITVKVTGGTAKNVKVYENFSNNLKIDSHNETVGEFNPATGIWDIGDLSSSDTAYLTVYTKVLSTEGRLNNTVDATTTSNDINLANNHAYLYAKSSGGKITSNTTETSDTRQQANHGDHHESQETGIVKREDETKKDESNIEKQETETNRKSDEQGGTNSNPGENSGQGGNSGSDDGGGSKFNNGESTNNGVFLTKSTESLTSAVSETLESIISIFDSNSTNKDSNSKANLSYDVVKAIAAQDYTKIPILIFAVFLIALIGIVGYGKIKA